MRPARFQTGTILQLLRRQQIATIGDLKAALGTSADMTVFRKLREIDYLTSYSHRGRFYALKESARFDDRGLWFCGEARFSRFGTLLDTAAEVVSQSEQGYYAPELVEDLQVAVKDALRILVSRRRLAREDVDGLYLYLSTDAEARRRQKLYRETAIVAKARAQDVVGGEVGRGTSDEVRALILLFCTLLDEQQRRLFAGLESLRVGRGGDRKIAEVFGLDPHTVGRGRKELAAWDLQLDRVRRPGAGRPRLEKKRPK
jgi:hypothetical protein